MVVKRKLRDLVHRHQRRLGRTKKPLGILLSVIALQSLIFLPIFQRLISNHVVVTDVDTHDDDHELCQKFQNVHIVFSTSCSRFQHWQSYAFFYHALMVGQPGNITRIASGCTEQEQRLYARLHDDEVVQKMSTRFQIHFTPDYSNQVIAGQSYKFFNKPFGLRHWMERSLGYPSNQRHEDTIIALLDPDMILTRPLINNFDGFRRQYWYKGDKSGVARTCVTRGKPIAQQYGFGNDWIASIGNHFAELVGKDSPVHNVTEADGPYIYSAGPPYLLTGHDMYKVVNLWCEFLVKIYQYFPFLMAEMYGYSMAVAHLQLRHQLSFQTMISEPTIPLEGWQHLEGLTPNQTCGREHVSRLPTIIHYCQYYSVGLYAFQKYYMQENFLSCEAPLLRNPPKNLAERYNVRRLLNGSIVPFDDRQQAMRFTFMLCTVTEALNEAVTHFKQNHCNDSANFNATYTPFPVD